MMFTYLKRFSLFFEIFCIFDSNESPDESSPDNSENYKNYDNLIMTKQINDLKILKECEYSSQKSCESIINIIFRICKLNIGIFSII